MGSLVVGSESASFVAESEVGAAILPALGGAVRSYGYDRTRFGPKLGGMRKDMLAFYPFLNDASPRPINLVTGRRAYAWDGVPQFSDSPIMRGGAMSHPMQPATQFSHSNLFESNPGPLSEIGVISCWVKVLFDDVTKFIPVAVIGQNLSESVSVGFFAGGFAIAANSGAFAINELVVTTSTTYVEGAWHHVVWGSDSAVWRIWVDGVEQAVAPSIGSNFGYWSSDLAIIGAGPFNLEVSRQLDSDSSAFFAIHELGVWNRLLTTAEINQLYREPDSIYARKRQVFDVDPSDPTRAHVCPIKHVFETQCVNVRIGATPRMQALSHVFEMQPSGARVGATPRVQALSHVFEMQSAAAIMGGAPRVATLHHVFETQPAAAVMGAAPTIQSLSHIYETQPATVLVGATPTVQTISHVYETQPAHARVGAIVTPQALSHVYETQCATVLVGATPTAQALSHVFVMQSVTVEATASTPVSVEIMACAISHAFAMQCARAAIGTTVPVGKIEHVYVIPSASPIMGGAPRVATLSQAFVMQPAAPRVGTVVLPCSLHHRYVLWPVSIDTPVAPVAVTLVTATVIDDQILASVDSSAIVASIADPNLVASVLTAPIIATVDSNPITATVQDDTINATVDC